MPMMIFVLALELEDGCDEEEEEEDVCDIDGCEEGGPGVVEIKMVLYDIG